MSPQQTPMYYPLSILYHFLGSSCDTSVSRTCAWLPGEPSKGTKASKASGDSLQATAGEEGTAEVAIWQDCGLQASCWRACSCRMKMSQRQKAKPSTPFDLLVLGPKLFSVKSCVAQEQLDKKILVPESMRKFDA